MDSVIVYAVGLLAVLYVAYRLYKSATSTGGCGGGCGSSSESESESGCGCGCGGHEEQAEK